MRKIIAQNDFGEKATFDKWNGKFYAENDLNEIVHVTEDTAIFRPDSTLDGDGVPIAYVITDAVLDDNITVGCASGAVQILELQRQGKNKQTTKEFLLGKKINKGTILV